MSELESFELLAGMPETSRLPAGFVASLLFHGLAVFVVSFGVFYVPPLDPRPLHDHLAVRRIALDSPDRPAHHPLFAPAHAAPAAKHANAQALKAAPPLKLPKKSRQLLLQPDLPTEADLVHEVPLPTVVVWTAENRRTPEIAPPTVQEPVTADVRPAPDAPNLETELAEASLVPEISASLKMPAVVAATTPIRIHAPGHTVKPPSMTTTAKTAPTPAAVMALGELQLKHGTAVLPAINETANESNGTTGLDTRNQIPAEHPAAQAKDPAPASEPVRAPAAPADPHQAQAAGAMERAQSSASFEAAEDTPLRTSQITLARDGQFGAVVVGASIEDQYPELTSVWRGRMAYTVYLHVGLRRSWTLEYAVPSDEEAAAAGAVEHLEAPWPFSIVRPNLPAGTFNADALMVHGYVNAEGRFEDLNLAFPADFPDASFVLKSLAQWQFRPASSEGKPVRVEVLLVIPEL
jgi:hypothetical protein